MPGGVRVEHHLRASGDPSPQRLRHGKLAHPQHDARLVRTDEVLGAEKQVVVSHHAPPVVRAASHAGRRVGQQRPSQRRGQARGGLRVRGGSLAAHDHPMGLFPEPLRHAGQVAGVDRPLGAADLRPGAVSGAAGPDRGVQVLGLGGQRRAEGEVEVHRARATAGRGVHRATRERAVVHGRGTRGLVGAHLHEPLGRGTEETQLVDRLPGAHVAELGGAVGREHEERGGGLARLGHRGMEIGRRGARGAGHGHRPARGPRHAEREEPRRALVDHRDALDVPPGGEGKDDRGVARARACHRVAHPAPGQLLHKGLERSEGPVQGRHGGARYSTGRPPPA